ncbi:SHOCT domain-containing protein [Micromonospora sp. WMMD812]|uniref:SHOCT domain-containing protein n=1 Tax=Micromonospora sp. WMMD812 TaxID=3015152 RepID=UPI00248C46BB|nr:SHOCT domain-containing protein [Micromonospora sp. WMMD812]WBB68479.1 SHOCT domain-containing protein [Micromonospora sp. WMMD812]
MTVAVALMAIVSVGYLVDAAAILSGASAYPDRVRDAMIAAEIDPRAVEVLRPLVSVLPYGAAGITAVAAVILLGVALWVRAGSFVGRIFAWVTTGLSLVCGLGALGSSGTVAFSGIARVSAYSSDESGTFTFAQSLPDAYPPAYRHLSTAVGLAAMLALIVVAVLLARPAANRFFRPFVELTVAQASAARTAPTIPIGTTESSAWVGAAAAPAPPTDGPAAELALLIRKHQRGELTDEEFTAARDDLLGGR